MDISIAIRHRYNKVDRESSCNVNKLQCTNSLQTQFKTFFRESYWSPNDKPGNLREFIAGSYEVGSQNVRERFLGHFPICNKDDIIVLTSQMISWRAVREKGKKSLSPTGKFFRAQ